LRTSAADDIANLRGLIHPRNGEDAEKKYGCKDCGEASKYIPRSRPERRGASAAENATDPLSLFVLDKDDQH
jgi:hypothetical protein